MDITVEQLKARHQQLSYQESNLLADLNATMGARQECERLIAHMEATDGQETGEHDDTTERREADFDVEAEAPDS